MFRLVVATIRWNDVHGLKVKLNSLCVLIIHNNVHADDK